MVLPLPRVIPDVGQGGGITTAMNGINSLANDFHKREINKVKADYAPLTTQAEAASKLAYANLVNPQYIAKIMSNPQFMANLSEEQKNMLKDLAYNAGIRNQGTVFMQNPLAQLQGEPQSYEDGSFTGWLKNSLKNTFSRPQQQQAPTNPLAQNYSMPQSHSPQEIAANAAPVARPKDGVTLEGQQWYNSKGEPVWAEEEKLPNGSEMKLELTKGIPPKTYAQKAGEFQGEIEQRKQEGKYRAQALHAIGQSQLGLSHSGTVLDRLTGIFTNPVFVNMRNKFPGFQSKQLDYLKVMGTPEEKELIGDFLSTAESFIASTVQGFSGKPLVREFDLAQRQKITPHDTVESAIGKLNSSRALHDIAEKKNDIVSELLEKGYNESEAVRMANKMVDVSAIEKETENRLQRIVPIRNKKTGKILNVTLKKAREMGVPNV